MSAYSWPCQIALKRALQTITAVAGRIYDIPPFAPGEEEFPYLQIGDSEIVPDDAAHSTIAGASDDGIAETIDIHVWARGHAGKKTVKEIADEIHDRLHGADLAITGRASSLAWVRRIQVEVEPDALTTHALIALQVIHRS